MAKAYIKKNVVWFRTGVQKAGEHELKGVGKVVPEPQTFNKARLEEWAENMNLLPYKAPVGFGRHVKSTTEVPVDDVEELYFTTQDGKMVPLFAQMENARVIDDKDNPGESLFISDVRGRDKHVVSAVASPNFPGRSLRIAKNNEGKEYPESGTCLGRAEPPAVEGLPSPPSMVIEAATFQKFQDEEVDAENEALTVVMDSPDIEEDSAQDNNNRQEDGEMPDQEKTLAEQLEEAKATVARIEKTAQDAATAAISFSKVVETSDATNKELTETISTLTKRLEEVEQRRIEGEVLSFSQSLIEKHGLTKVHAERVRQLGVAMSFGRDKLTFSGETDERPLVEQFKLTFSELCNEGVKAFVPKGESAPLEGMAAPTAGVGKPPETKEELLTFARAGTAIPEDDLQMIVNDLTTSAGQKRMLIEKAQRGEAI